jgi:hypothetical protein
MPRGTSPLDAARLQARLWTPQVIQGDTAGWWSYASLPGATRNAGGFFTAARNLTGKAGDFADIGGSDFFRAQVGSLNGRPAALCIASGGESQAGTAANVGFNASDFLAYQVLRMDSGTTGNGRFLTYYQSGGNDFNQTGSVVLIQRGGGANTIITFHNFSTIATTSVSLATPMIFGVIRTGSTVTHRLNGANGGSGTLGTTLVNNGIAAFGYNGGSGEPIAGLIAETILIRATPDAALVNRIEGHLAWAWGLESILAPGHAHRNSPPLIGD